MLLTDLPSISGAEVGPAEVGLDEVWPDVLVLLPPRIPRLKHLAPESEMLRIRHCASSLCACLTWITGYMLRIASLGEVREGQSAPIPCQAASSACQADFVGCRECKVDMSSAVHLTGGYCWLRIPRISATQSHGKVGSCPLSVNIEGVSRFQVIREPPLTRFPRFPLCFVSSLIGLPAL